METIQPYQMSPRETPTTADPETLYTRQEQEQKQEKRIWEALGKMPQKEAAILIETYGLAPNPSSYNTPTTQKQLAKNMGLSTTQVRQLKKQGLRRLEQLLH